MGVMGCGDINRFDFGIGIKLLHRIVDLRDPVCLSKRLGLGFSTVSDACYGTTGKLQRLGHLIGDNATADNSPAQFGSRENVAWKRFALNGCECRFCGSRRIEGSLLGICHVASGEFEVFISDKHIFAQARAFVRVFACFTDKRS